MADVKKNQPPTGQGKRQRPIKGASRKLDKRSDIMQASHAAQNLQSDQDELNRRDNPSQQKNNRPKGRR